jgi:hypothetical protein
MITVVMPLASVAVGVVALHETAHLNGARIVIMMACLAVAITALARLARAAAAVAQVSKQPDDDHRPAERAEHPAEPISRPGRLPLMSTAPMIPAANSFYSRVDQFGTGASALDFRK